MGLWQKIKGFFNLTPELGENTEENIKQGDEQK